MVNQSSSCLWSWKKYSLGFWSEVCLKLILAVTMALVMITMIMVT